MKSDIGMNFVQLYMRKDVFIGSNAEVQSMHLQLMQYTKYTKVVLKRVIHLQYWMSLLHFQGQCNIVFLNFALTA